MRGELERVKKLAEGHLIADVYDRLDGYRTDLLALLSELSSVKEENGRLREALGRLVSALAWQDEAVDLPSPPATLEMLQRADEAVASARQAAEAVVSLGGGLGSVACSAEPSLASPTPATVAATDGEGSR